MSTYFEWLPRGKHQGKTTKCCVKRVLEKIGQINRTNAKAAHADSQTKANASVLKFSNGGQLHTTVCLRNGGVMS